MRAINTNLFALNPQRQLGRSSLALTTSVPRLSCGLRITSEPDTVTGSVNIFGTNPGAAGLSAGANPATLTGATQQELRSAGIGGERRVDISTVAGANATLDYIDAKIDGASTIRAALGALENRFELIVRSTGNSAIELSAARARIRDTDYASETAQFARSQILQ